MAEENREYILGKQVLHEDDLKFTVKYKDENFVMRYPTTTMRAQIEADIARRIGGAPRESISPEALAVIEMTAYVNAIIVPSECPKWFQDNVKSLWDHYDELLIMELYRGYADFRDRFRDNLSNGRYEVGRTGSAPGSVGM